MKNKRELLKKYVSDNLDKLYRLAFSFAQNQDDAEDIVNESIVRALAAIDSLRESNYLGTWLYRIVVNTANTFLKKKSKIVYLDETICNDEGKEDTYFDVDLYQKVMNLSPKYKLPVILRFYEDLPISQIANILSENEKTVKTRLYTALSKLKITINEEMKCDEKRF